MKFALATVAAMATAVAGFTAPTPLASRVVNESSTELFKYKVAVVGYVFW